MKISVFAVHPINSPADFMSFCKGKTVLITGASAGIGEALAHEFANDGAHLILTARRRDRLLILAEHLTARHGIDVTIIDEDLSDPAAPARLHGKIQSLKLNVDILVNNAGLGNWSDFAAADPAIIETILDVNIRALVLLSRLFLPSFLEKGGGGIINIASTAAFIPVPGLAIYAASKAFVLSFSESLWGEYHDKGIQVLALCPGNTTTEFDDIANTVFKGPRYDTAERVAKDTLNAFEHGKTYHVVGTDNYFASQLSRFLPRRSVIKIVNSVISRKTKKS